MSDYQPTNPIWRHGFSTALNINTQFGNTTTINTTTATLNGIGEMILEIHGEKVKPFKLRLMDESECWTVEQTYLTDLPTIMIDGVETKGVFTTTVLGKLADKLAELGGFTKVTKGYGITGTEVGTAYPITYYNCLYEMGKSDYFCIQSDTDFYNRPTEVWNTIHYSDLNEAYPELGLPTASGHGGRMPFYREGDKIGFKYKLYTLPIGNLKICHITKGSNHDAKVGGIKLGGYGYIMWNRYSALKSPFNGFNQEAKFVGEINSGYSMPYALINEIITDGHRFSEIIDVGANILSGHSSYEILDSQTENHIAYGYAMDSRRLYIGSALF